MNLLDRHYWALQKWRGDKIVLTVEPFTDGSWHCVRTIPGMTCASCLPALHGACSQNSIRLKKGATTKLRTVFAVPRYSRGEPRFKPGTGIEPAISNVLPTAFVAKHCSDKIADTQDRSPTMLYPLSYVTENSIR
jgi:hypothetical protein